jgi:hypothetical protein
MFKPAKIRQMVTPAIHQSMKTETVNNRTQKKVTATAIVRGQFKLKGTSEINANGLVVVYDKTTFITLWKKKNPYKSGDILIIGGVDYEVKGTPENTEMRGRYCVMNLERIGGGV